MATIYDYKAIASNGKEIDFADFKGKVLMIINTASKCGFTPQFDGLEKLNEKYADRGLVMLGFPCNQFANQDPGTDSEITEFCRINYGVTFQIMQKILLYYLWMNIIKDLLLELKIQANIQNIYYKIINLVYLYAN